MTPGAEGNKNAFPILVNSNVDRLDCSVTAKSINIKIINQEGKEIHSHSLSK